jgi:hypothetical protein
MASLSDETLTFFGADGVVWVGIRRFLADSAAIYVVFTLTLRKDDTCQSLVL